MGRAFLTDSEREAIQQRLRSQDRLTALFFDALHQRVYRRVRRKQLQEAEDTTAWYYPAAEYLSDAAMLYALQPEADLAGWIRVQALQIAGASLYDWVGPAFRSHAEPLSGHLETAHLCWALASVLDLAEPVFSENELAEVKKALQEKGILLCRCWLSANSHLANWRGILTSGLLVAAVVLDDEETVDGTLAEWQTCTQAFQPDGSYAESLQYGNYLAYALMLSYEAVARKYPQKAEGLDVAAYARGIRWIASSMFYAKPMTGWGEEPRARAANFNDSAALFRSSGDLLLHIASRHSDTTEAGLARWLFKTYYEPVPYQGPHDLATFGMVNDWGFMTLPLLTYEVPVLSPGEVSLPLVSTFSNGHAFIRDGWDGQTILAINGGGEGLHGPGHLHGDLNSFILCYNQERLLTDPGHSCYRNLIHGLESSSQTHTTCTFLVENDALGLQEDLAKATLLEQKSVLARRLIRESGISAPINRGNHRLIAERDDCISVVGAEVSAVYGAPLTEFTRLWIMAGSHIVFVVDSISSQTPVTTVWNWLVNNRDGKTNVESKDRSLTIKRNEAGLRLFHLGKGTLSHPVYGYVHDAYHVEPNQRGEGKPGSGLVYRFTEKVSQTHRTVVHALALDDSALIGGWNLHSEGNSHTLTNGKHTWTLHLQDGKAETLSMISGHGRRWDITGGQAGYSLRRIHPTDS
ncbi:heparinase II/III domain-containing protein [Telluribacter humicola]|uniref:heparinase II/III domain-containing protein n=1 Tax=Telluribacter humicola TaxID=1720261 RepID=UPI001A9569AF|nr:heparinase II/III family protein [Telluribacter humicola]